MNILSIQKLTSLRLDEKAVVTLTPILSNPNLCDFITQAAASGATKLSHQVMKEKFNVDYSILFVSS